jgi:DNA helicase II / ATP-dependent DNA helicase PcrA
MPPSAEQQAVIEHDGTHPARLLAGPGTGKSYTLAQRVGDLIRSGADPKRMLLISFTRLSAIDLGNAIATSDLGEGEPPESLTLHSYCFRQLRARTGEAFVGRHVIDGWEFNNLIRLDLGRRLNMSPGRVSEVMQEYDAAWRTLGEPPTFPQRQAFETALEDLRGILHFALQGELVHQFLKMLDGDPTFDPELDHLIVDEYQDLNRCDQEVIQRLANRGACLIVAGDDDQSLYGFRHANPDGIIEFPASFETCGDFSLNECRRCSDEVLQPALRLIEHNPTRVPKALHSNRTGGEVIAYAFRGPRKQAEGVAEIVRRELDNGVDPNEIFVLLPRKAFAEGYLEEFDKAGIPAIDLANGARLLDEPEIRRLVYLLRFTADRGDARAVRGWLATTHGVGVGSVGNVLDLAIAEHLDIRDAIERSGVSLAQNAYAELVGFADDLDPEQPAIETLELAGQMLELDPERRDGFRQVIQTVTGSEGDLGKVLAVLHEYREQPQVGDGEQAPVRLMTLHGAKGLSADAVVIPDLEDVLVPGDGEVVEQRRLMYVSMTRARYRLYLCHALFRGGATSYAGAGARQPGPQRRRSRFLDEAGIQSTTG